MPIEQVLALAVLGGSVALFAHGRLRVDLVAVLVILALIATGLCSPAEAVAGFGSTVVVMVGSLLVVGEGLTRTGAAGLAGSVIMHLSGGGEKRTRALLILAAATLGSVMSSTAVVALLLPVALRIADEHQLPPVRLLLPMAYGALISGMLTLIGTPPNLVVHAELRAAGLPGFRFFDFLPVGGLVLAAAVVTFTWGGRWLLPHRKAAPATPAQPRIGELWPQYVAGAELARLAVRAGSALVGRTARDLALGSGHGVRVVGLERGRVRYGRPPMIQPSPDQRFAVGDVLVAVGAEQRITALRDRFDLDRLVATDGGGIGFGADFGVAVVMVRPDSELLGRSLADVGFRTRYRLDVVGVRREGGPLTDFVQQPLRPADMLLVLGPWPRIEAVRGERQDLILLNVPAHPIAPAPARHRLPIALAILVLMVAVTATGLVQLVTAALAAALLMVLTGCLRASDIYQPVAWSSLVLVAGMLPLAGALERTGVLAAAVGGLQHLLADAGPAAVLAALFVVTALIGSFLSNTATAVLMAPVALEIAAALRVAPEPLALTVAIASSAAFLTPMASPVVTLVYEAGGYRPADLLRAGLPLFVAALLSCTFVLPWLLLSA